MTKSVKKPVKKTTKKTTKKKAVRTRKPSHNIYISLSLFAVGLLAVAITLKLNISNPTPSQTEGDGVTISDTQLPAFIVDDRGEVIETTEYNGMEIPTVDEVDGGLFEDEDETSSNDGEYDDKGAVIETYPTSTPEAFRDATLGLCVYASNKFGAQCVSLSRSYWFSYAGRDVSTCGTGMAKGMMNCTEQNAGDDFLVFWGSNGIQDGDWIVSDGGQYGHICMALGPVVNGYVACLGENQGGKKCEKGGAATNIINYSVKNVIGYYRPKAYVKPIPDPTPTPSYNCKTYKVVAGDTMGTIMKACLGYVKWGQTMNEYANSWYSNMLGNTVFYGWTHGTGYGLLAGDIIEYKD